MRFLILDARRTPIGSFLGAFKDLSAVELGAAAATPLPENKKLGVASLCIGGGMGIAMVLRSI